MSNASTNAGALYFVVCVAHLLYGAMFLLYSWMYDCPEESTISELRIIGGFLLIVGIALSTPSIWKEVIPILRGFSEGQYIVLVALSCAYPLVVYFMRVYPTHQYCKPRENSVSTTVNGMNVPIVMGALLVAFTVIGLIVSVFREGSERPMQPREIKMGEVAPAVQARPVAQALSGSEEPLLPEDFDEFQRHLASSFLANASLS